MGVIPTSLADATLTIVTAVVLTSVDWRNRYHLFSNKCCLISQYLFKHIKWNLRQGIVMSLALEAIIALGGLNLYLGQVLHDNIAAVRGLQQGVNRLVTLVL